ncbi:MAG TPA: TonB C-terminal domain-containing protein [Candidatus Sulfotelmatobacter sp.]|nr:TonB C-terminal domain-containing protein [Candidatus Sulfotelmatobacter sp.]
MIPQSKPKKPANSSKVNLTISFVFHAVLLLALLYFAAHEGYLGKKMKSILVTKVEEKKPEPPKPKEEPKVEPPKVETPKVEAAKVEAPKVAPTIAPPVVAPAAVDVPSFDFAGGKTVVSENDPVQLYKGYIEYVLRTKWNRPENMDDDRYVAEVGVSVDPNGNLSNVNWEKGSGNAQWDASVKDVFKDINQIDRKPPTNFPDHVTIRFDVQEETEPVLQ